MRIKIHKAQRVLQRATGDGIYSWPLTVAVVVVVTLTTVATQVPATYLNVAQIAFIAIASVAIMFGFVSLSWLTLLRWLTGTQRIVATLAVYAVSGLVQALAIFWLVPHLGGMQISLLELTYRSIAYLLLMTILLSLGTYVVTTSRLHKKRFQLLLARRAAVSSLLAEIQRKIREDQQSALDSIAIKLSSELDEIAQESPARAIISTEHLVGDVVRPLSHQIAQEVPQVRLPELDTQDFEISWRKLWRRLPAEQYLRPISTSLVISIYVLLLQISFFEATKLDIYLLVFPVLVIGLWVARLVLRPLASIRSRAWRAILSTIVIAVLVLPAAVVLTHASGYGLERWDLLATFVIEAVIITWLMTLAFGLADTLRVRERELDKLDDTITYVQARGNGELWQANGQLARALHGPVQSELHAALFTIRRANANKDNQDSESSQQITTETIAQLVQSLPRLLVGGHSRHSLLQEVEETASVWQGICDIQFYADPTTVTELASDLVANDLVISIVQDAISNSIRHGGATSVEVALDQNANNLVTLRITDNGSKGIGSGTAGLGTHMLQDCTVSWSLKPSNESLSQPSGSILKATLPTQTTSGQAVADQLT
ncbi:MAG: hypothetical protein WAS05_08525 [Candidatus Nanopelagicales bacterium]